MKYVQINENNTASFRPLAGADRLAAVDKRRTFAIGAVVEKGKKEGGIPAGILIFLLGGEDLAVHKYLYVEPKYRGMGIATELMHRFYDIAGGGIKRVRVIIPDTEEGALLRNFYEGFEYRFVPTHIRRVHASIEDLEKNPVITGFLGMPGIMAPEELPYGERLLRQFLVRVPEQQLVRMQELSAAEPDLKLSSVFVKNGEIKGAFLVEKTPEGKVVPVLLYAKSGAEKSILGLLSSSLEKVRALLGKQGIVEIDCERGEVGALMDKLYPMFHPILAWRGEYVR